MHTYVQPARKNQQAMPAALLGTSIRADEISMTAEKSFNNISANVPHNFSHVPSSEQIIQPCGCGKCAECEEEENEEQIGTVQRKLTVSQPGDPFEREADHVADQIMKGPLPNELDDEEPTMAAPSISRWTGNTGDIGREEGEQDENNAEPEQEEEEEQEKQLDISSLLSLKGKSNKIRTPSAKVTKQIHSMQGHGKPMEPAVRSFFEPRFQRDFSNVRRTPVLPKPPSR